MLRHNSAPRHNSTPQEAAHDFPRPIKSLCCHAVPQTRSLQEAAQDFPRLVEQLSGLKYSKTLRLAGGLALNGAHGAHGAGRAGHGMAS